MPDDDDDNDVARLPVRPGTASGTRTDTRLTPREVTSITKPLFTADESAEEDAVVSDPKRRRPAHFDDVPTTSPGMRDDVDDSEADLFEDPATVAEVDALAGPGDPTRISRLRNDVARDNHGDDEHNDEADDDDDGAERTVVSMVVPEHLLDPPSTMAVTDGLFEASELDDLASDFVPNSTEVVTVRLPARPTSTARPEWLLAAMVFAAVIGTGLVVIAVVALFR